jgi:hypothetical protein
MEHVYFVVGECDEDIDDGNVFYRRFGNMDNNVHLWALSESGRRHLQQYEWMLSILDTCIALPNFTQSVFSTIELFGNDSVNALKVYGDFSMSCGYYRLSCLWSPLIAGYINSMVNYDLSPETLMRMKSSGQLEDSVFNRINLLFPNTVRALPNWRVQTHNEPNTYGTDTKRLIEAIYFPSMLKTKANHNVGPGEWTIEL